MGLTLRLVDNGKLSFSRAIEMLTSKPASIVNLDAGTLEPGKAADVCIFDPKKTYTYTTDRIQSKSKNSPFIDWELPGEIRYTIVDGKTVYTG